MNYRLFSRAAGDLGRGGGQVTGARRRVTETACRIRRASFPSPPARTPLQDRNHSADPAVRHVMGGLTLLFPGDEQRHRLDAVVDAANEHALVADDDAALEERGPSPPR